MLKIRLSVLILAASLCLPGMLSATDFGWCPRLNQQAEQNPNNYRLSLGERFRINDQQLDLVLSNVARPADAYTLLRLGEMAKLPPERMVEHYQADQAKGWGVMARNLGIKPGSAEFHALKRGHDLRDYRAMDAQHLKKAVKPTAKPNKAHHRSELDQSRPPHAKHVRQTNRHAHQAAKPSANKTAVKHGHVDSDDQPAAANATSQP